MNNDGRTQAISIATIQGIAYETTGITFSDTQRIPSIQIAANTAMPPRTKMPPTKAECSLTRDPILDFLSTFPEHETRRVADYCVVSPV